VTFHLFFLSSWRCDFCKDAGFVHESFQNKTNRVIWNFFFHKTNPQNDSFKNESTKRIHETNLSKKVYETNPQNESFEISMDSRIRSLGFVRIRACLKYIYVLRIRKDLSGFVKTGRIFWKSVYETNPRNESFENIKDSWSMIQNESRFVNHEMKQIFLESGFVTTIQNESPFLRISYTIPWRFKLWFCFVTWTSKDSTCFHESNKSSWILSTIAPNESLQIQAGGLANPNLADLYCGFVL
jgi:hypothetical protein